MQTANQQTQTQTQLRSDGTLYYVTGSMGSGKTSWIKQRVKSSRRVLVWDGKGIDWGERDGFRVVDSPHELRRVLFGANQQRISYRVPISKDNFAIFCRLAWVWGRYQPGTIIIDEIADVTTPQRAPVELGEIARKSRAFGTDVYATTQRPQECDKTIQGNAMVYHCGRMSDADDQRYIAKRLLGGVEVGLVSKLQPLEWIERDARTLQITQGKLQFKARSSAKAHKKNAGQ
jgi:hypothetical protein